jgi:sigma-B regulation protein RsbU (phosphoserine phosphatase)
LRFPLLRTLPGKLFVLSSIPLVVLLVVREFVALPDLVEVFRKVLSLAFLVSIVVMAAIALRQQRQRLLWRVRRKLLVSYVLLGFVPVALVAAFMLFSSIVLYTYVSAYVFQQGMTAIADAAHRSAEMVAQEVAATPQAAKLALDREYGRRVFQFPELSIALVPVGAAAPARAAPSAVAGPWRYLPAPTTIPSWIVVARDYRGFVAVSTAGSGHADMLVVRAAVPLSDGRAFVVVDLPIDQRVITDVRARTGMQIGAITVNEGQAEAAPERGKTQVVPPPAPLAPAALTTASAFRQTVAFLGYNEWTTRAARTVSIHLEAPVADLYGRLAAAQPGQVGLGVGADPWSRFLDVLLAIGVLFLVIQTSALIVGAFFARQITSAVHDLFAGTERVQQGDFAHRIPIRTRDQLGDLADSFNRMSASIEHLLHVQREKQRLDDELRIARNIQQSLLPVQPPAMDGLDVSAVCEPAREVGGDYYDFFDLGPRQLGVLMADVSGKGTSAALYMAEVKGMMLALTRSLRSPRQLLVEANRLLAAHLDNRSFITMTYAIIDLEARTLTCARAGHTPVLVVAGGTTHVVSPEGMVVGLRLPGASERFETLLEEHTRPIHDGDVIVLYTDGITEAMNPAGDLFGDTALASALENRGLADAAALRDAVLGDVRAFVGPAEQHDDMTMVILRVAAA